MERAESQFLLEYIKQIPIKYSESFEELKKLDIKSSLDEENRELLQELKSRERTLEELTKYVGNFIENSEKDAKNQQEISSFLATKLENTIIKLNSYKKCKGDLMKQNQLLTQKVKQLSELLDEEEKKSQNLRETLRNHKENLEIIERKEKILTIFDFRKNLREIFEENLDFFKQNFPSCFCECQGNFSEFKRKIARISEENRELQEKCLESCAKHKEIAETLAFSLQENRKLKAELQAMKMKQSNSLQTLRVLSGELTNFQEKPQQSRKKQRTRPSSLMQIKKQKIPKQKFLKLSANSEETLTLLSDLENSALVRRETVDCLNFAEKNAGFFENFLEKFEQMEISSPDSLKSKSRKTRFAHKSPRNSIKLQNFEENAGNPVETSKKSLRNPNKFSVLVLCAMIYLSFLMRFLGFFSKKLLFSLKTK